LSLAGVWWGYHSFFPFFVRWVTAWTFPVLGGYFVVEDMDIPMTIVGFALALIPVVALAIVFVVRFTNCTVLEAAEAIGGVVRSVGHALRRAFPGGKDTD
jgi:hypothetical protein